MLIYVIPFILLLVVAIVLKKREASKEADTAPKKTATARNKAKTPVNKRKAPQKAQVVEDPVIEKKQETPLSEELRSQIQGQIRDRNFFAAEAQINQALNKDNSQHELYLLLLDIHLEQKDEFAISQLFNHLRSLELEETLAQAEQKKAEYEKEHLSSVDTIDFQPQTLSNYAEPSTATQNASDFDALIENKVTTSNSFDLLQAETPSASPVEEKPLEFKSFNVSPEIIEPTVEATPESDAPSLKFDDLVELKPQVEEPAQVQDKNELPVTELKDLEFSFNLDPAPTTEAVVETVTAPIAEKSEDQPEFKFSFDLEQPNADKSTSQIEVQSEAPAISFDLESPKTDLATAHSIPQDITETTEFTTPALQTDAHLQDPLVQSFPELGQISETTLDLDLAERYIQFGSYEAARQLLAANSDKFSTEQQHRAEQLLNQIAS
ncbi:hypothetical protein [Acinetobacter tandoii]|uniref:FimV domain-containing protein n=1 Tax=Acinetobacter tandoii DSM 14970 = CIP 107469 TaxID=1120927 RepID=R9AQQ3_9GAMM|nr:hypothetical protein [Acinetobacter tandoii]EOR04523.1 hypothetical protein I593_03271 [Acinetobacter tandoii DSM 14970 = CIP 107469]